MSSPYFEDRELGLIDNCLNYAGNEPAGLPAHNLMIVVAKMAALIDGINTGQIPEPFENWHVDYIRQNMFRNRQEPQEQ